MVKNPITHYLHFQSSLPVLMHYFEEVAFFLPLTESNLGNARVNDRFDAINRMYLGTETPNLYVLGNIVEHIPGMTYLLTGTDALRFSVSSEGQIVLINNTGLVAGNLSFNLVVNTLGTLAITVPVVSNATGLKFYADAANGGNDANSGLQPHIPKLTIPTSLSGTHLLKRGSTFNSTSIALSGILRGYGDPSAPRPIINDPLHGTENVNISASNSALYDITLSGGIRGVYSFYRDNINIRRCNADGCGVNGNNNSQGFYFKGGSGTIRHIETENCYGDGVYLTDPFMFELGFMYLGTPFGSAGDCFEISHEGAFSKWGYEIWLHDTIMTFGQITNSAKGASVFQGVTGWCIENVLIPKGNYFGLDLGGSHGTVRNCYARDSFLVSTNNNEYNGIGNQFQNDTIDVVDSYFIGTYRGFSISGYNGPHDRADIYLRGNTIALCKEASKSTERNTCKISGNIFAANVSNAHTSAGNGATPATLVGNITAFTNNGNGTGTFTTSAARKVWPGDSVVVAGMSQAVLLNKTHVVTAVSTDTSFTVAITGAELNETGATGTYAKVLEFATIDTSGNSYQNQLGTHIKVRPTIAGNCQDGQSVTVSYPTIAGHTVEIEWCLNNRPWAGKTAATCSIPALTSAGPRNKNMPQNPAWNLHLPSLSCRLKYIDPNGNWSFVTAIWPDGSVYKTIAA